MRVYLAAAYERHEEMRGVRDILMAFGHEITSRWIDRAAEMPPGTVESMQTDPMRFAEAARIDLADLDNAETVLSFAGHGRGGRHTEFGFGLARGKYMIHVGAREHVFHTLAAEWYPDWTGLVMAITGRPPISALYFLHPNPAHATDEFPVQHGAPATRFWPFSPAEAEGTLPGEDARDVAAKLGVPQEEDVSRAMTRRAKSQYGPALDALRDGGD